VTERPDLTPPEPEQPSASDILGAALGNAARRAGLDPAEDSETKHVVWAAMGGWRGILESVLPSLAFVVLFTVTQHLVLSLGVSVGIAAIFTAVRLLQRQPVGAALGGLIAAGAAAALALWTGRAEDNFVWGFLTNGLYGGAFLISAVIGWPLIGLAVGFLMGEGVAWRADKRKRRVFFWLSIAWAALFAARLLVQLPLYFAGDVTALGTFKLIMGLPLFAPLVAVTWLAVRTLYPSTPK
jgi:MFS family permease